MKRLLKILRVTFFALLGLVVLVVAGLLFYYQSLYEPTPLPQEQATLPPTYAASPAPDKPVLLPVPKKLLWKDGRFNLPGTINFSAPAEDTSAISTMLQIQLGVAANRNGSAVIKITKDTALTKQAYKLLVLPNAVAITYSTTEGLFYAITTLKQLATQSNNKVPCVQIEDEPDLATRGALLDISRGKVPTLQTLFGIVDFLADLKYNQLQLYIEGFSFGYPSFKNLWEKTETPLMPEEIRQLDAYCKDRFIDLVPNQNSLGHMDAWLKTDQFKELAECPDGFKMLGLIDMKSTLAPANPGSLELVKKMGDDLLPNFQSAYFNVDLDEPFELGKNKQHPITDEKEIATIYINYAKELNKYVKSKGKKMMMWGDVVARTPEIIPSIPKDITLLEWRYEAMQPFKNICAQYQQAGLTYMVCPGTSSWSTFTGRTDNMMANVEDAVTNGIQYGAAGMLITDWGNTPHLQYLTVSYAGLAYGAALSWNNLPRAQVPLNSYLSRAVFKDSSNRIGDILLELGRYCQFEEYSMVAMTTTDMAYMFGIMDKTMLDAINKKMQSGIGDLLSKEAEVKKALHENFSHPKIYNAAAIMSYVDSLEKLLLPVQLNRPDSSLIKAEYANAIKMIVLGAKLKQYNNYHLQQTAAENKALLREMKKIMPGMMKSHEKLWLMRNKRSGLEQSEESFRKLRGQINDALVMLEKNSVSRWGSRTMEKIVSAAGALYLK